MYTNRIPRAWMPSGGGVTGNYTETMFTVTPTATGWKTYTADASIPANAVIEVLCRNKDDAVARNCGASAYNGVDTPLNSDRYFDVAYGQDSGSSNAVTLFVQLDASNQWTGYAEHTTDNEFIIIGYFEDITFTEASTDIAFTSSEEGVWIASDALATPFTGQADSVSCFVIGSNGGSVNHVGGIRKSGSTIDRYLTIGRGLDVSAIQFPVQMDASGNCEFYIDSYTSTTYRYTGYFSSELSYEEGIQNISNPASADTWTDVDLSSYLDQGGRIVTMHGATDVTSANTIGLRGTGNSEERSIAIGSLASYPYWGYSASCVSDSSSVVQIRCTDTAKSQFNYLGYFK